MSSTLGRLFFLPRLRTVPTADVPTCPICMDAPLTDPSITLTCGHVFCRDCIGPYVELKVRERGVANDQLVCPVVACRRALRDRDLRSVLATTEAYEQFKLTLQRVRDEQNPRARWCPRAECSALIVCTSLQRKTFTCTTCATVGCFHCRGLAHARGGRCDATPLQNDDNNEEDNNDDALYLQWEQSLENDNATAATAGTGTHRPVRPCPKCQMRIWKNEGCNHMTCTHCRHEYCWVCDATWSRRHYACGTAATTPLPRRPVVNDRMRHGAQTGATCVGLLLLIIGLEIVAAVGRAAQAAQTRGGYDVPDVAAAVRNAQPPLPPPRGRTLWISARVRRGWRAVESAIVALLVFLGGILFEILRAIYNAIRFIWSAIQRTQTTWPRVWRCIGVAEHVVTILALIIGWAALQLLTTIGRTGQFVWDHAQRVGRRGGEHATWQRAQRAWSRREREEE